MKTWAVNLQDFNDWWNQPDDDSNNPFAFHSPAYWAWAGWSAAKSAPAAEEAPQQEPDWSNSETLQTEIWKSRFYDLAERLLMADGAVAFERKVVENLRSQLMQQPATHGEPVAMANYTLTIEADSGYESTIEGRCNSEQYGLAVAALHGNASPQPTPSHIKAMQMALEALNTWLPMSGAYRAIRENAVAALQSALKGTS